MPKIENYILSSMAKDNFLITNTIKAWNILKKMFGQNKNFSCLTTLVDNPDLTVEGAGPDLRSWRDAGVARMHDLWHSGKFKTFEELRTQYGIASRDFYKYLQLRHYVKAKTDSLEVDCYLLDKAILDCHKRGRFVSRFYAELQTLRKDNLENLRSTWNRTLKSTIDSEAWEDILTLPSRISVCNRYKEMQYNILHNVYISPYIYSKYTPGSSPNCPKCKVATGTRIHCLWECKIIEAFWQAVCHEISSAIGQTVHPGPVLCLLGLIPTHLGTHKETVQLLLMLARKVIMVKWIGCDAPSIQLWKNLFSEVIVLERLRYSLDGKFYTFKRRWEHVLNYFKINK
uniref:Reverse transcriptase zinc-binding domain-containing protein n=1 Tax=Poecilia formosa TaxID=48698 RepID=A0A096LVM8_POEFO